MKRTICYVAGSARDWGGASRVLFTNVRRLDRARYEPLVLLPYPGGIIDELDKLGVRYRVWGRLHEPGNPIRYLRAIWQTTRMLRAEKVDIVHVNVPCWRPAEIVAAKLLHVPVLMHYHMVTPKASPAARMVTGIITVSRFVAEHSQPAGADKIVIYNATSLASIDQARDVRDELGIPKDAVVVSFIGQIRTIKGIDLFLRMAHSIGNETVRFVIAGRCVDPNRLKDAYTESRLREEIGSDKRIIYTGYRTDVQNIFVSSDIVVFPSQIDEAFPLVTVEAGAAAKPVVATRVGGVPEIIEDSVNGFLVERSDVSGLCNYVSQLIEDKPLRQQLGRNAREKVEREFTEKPIEDLQRLYDRIA